MAPATELILSGVLRPDVANLRRTAMINGTGDVSFNELPRTGNATLTNHLPSPVEFEGYNSMSRGHVWDKPVFMLIITMHASLLAHV